MERTLLSWSFPNIITVTLMASLGYLVFSIASQLVLARFQPQGSE